MLLYNPICVHCGVELIDVLQDKCWACGKCAMDKPERSPWRIIGLLVVALIVVAFFAGRVSAGEIDDTIKQIQAGNARIAKRLDAMKPVPEPEGTYSVSNRNFIVGAPSKRLAESLLAAAEHARADIPDGVEFTLIRVTLGEPDTTTLLCGPGRHFSGGNRVWVTAPDADEMRRLVEREVRRVCQEARVTR